MADFLQTEIDKLDNGASTSEVIADLVEKYGDDLRELIYEEDEEARDAANEPTNRW